MLRLLLDDIEGVIITFFIFFLILNVINIIRKYSKKKWDFMQELRYIIPLGIFSMLYLIKIVIDINNSGYAKNIIWVVIFIGIIINRIDLSKFKRK